MRFVFLTLMLLTIALPARAQTGHSSADVTALFSNKTVRAGDQAVIDVVVTVNKGLHAQSHTPLDEYAIPLVVTPDKMIWQNSATWNTRRRLKKYSPTSVS